eukprot:1160766-Pelagomonas_calceolata.AAC.10
MQCSGTRHFNMHTVCTKCIRSAQAQQPQNAYYVHLVHVQCSGTAHLNAHSVLLVHTQCSGTAHLNVQEPLAQQLTQHSLLKVAHLHAATGQACCLDVRHLLRGELTVFSLPCKE